MVFNERRRVPLWMGLALLIGMVDLNARATTPAQIAAVPATQAGVPVAAAPATHAPLMASATAPPTQPLAPAAAARFAGLALSCLHREYPNKIAHVMESDADALPPHVLTPAFYGCFDWHSDVHGHWLLVRLARLYPNAPFASEARAELARSLTPQNIAGEVSYLKREDRASFERPYGLAWLLQLASELRQWNDPQAKQWSVGLLPLETAAAVHLKILEGIAHGVGPDDRRSSALLAAANSHREAALPAVTGEHYEGGHWLGTFAVCLTSHAGY